MQKCQDDFLDSVLFYVKNPGIPFLVRCAGSCDLFAARPMGDTAEGAGCELGVSIRRPKN